MTESVVRRRFEMALRAGRIGTWRWDIATNVVDWDASMEELYGFAPGSFDGTYEAYASRLHPEDRPAVEAVLAELLRQRSPSYHVEHRTVLPTGEVRWFASTGQLSLDEDGEPRELIGVAMDVTDRRRAELERELAREAEGRARSEADASRRRMQLLARSSRRRMQMLARASSLLDAPLDLDATLQQVGELAIREIADWCTVDVLVEGRVHRVAVAHRDPTMIALAHALQARYPTDPQNPMLSEMLRTLEPVLVPEITEDMLRGAARDDEHLSMLRSLNLTSYLAVPLVAGTQGVGTMLLASSHGRTLDQEDVDLAVELGRRAGAAVDKTRLYEELSHTATTLQASLLPPALPSIPGLGLSAHYSSGTEGIDIGGDYYDVFRTSTSRWWVVLGDVCGKGPGAAALAAAVRYSLRALAPDTDDPAELVRRLNDLLLAGSWGERFTTLVIVTFSVDPGDGDAEPSAPLGLALVSGGHPPPLLRRGDGTVEAVIGPGTLVGVLPEVDVKVVELELFHGDTLLLYTDGATEARDSAGEQIGQGALVEILAGSGGPDHVGTVAEEIARALARRATGGFNDDLALLALTRTTGLSEMT